MALMWTVSFTLQARCISISLSTHKGSMQGPIRNVWMNLSFSINAGVFSFPFALVVSLSKETAEVEDIINQPWYLFESLLLVSSVFPRACFFLSSSGPWFDCSVDSAQHNIQQLLSTCDILGLIQRNYRFVWGLILHSFETYKSKSLPQHGAYKRCVTELGFRLTIWNFGTNNPAQVKTELCFFLCHKSLSGHDKDV